MYKTKYKKDKKAILLLWWQKINTEQDKIQEKIRKNKILPEGEYWQWQKKKKKLLPDNHHLNLKTPVYPALKWHSLFELPLKGSA